MENFFITVALLAVLAAASYYIYRSKKSGKALGRKIDMENFFITVALLAVLAAASYYIYRSKKSGKACIGCPDSGSCGSCSGGCGKGCPGCSHKGN